MGWRLRLSDKTVRKLAELPIYCQRQKCSQGNLVSGSIRFMQIFAGVRWRGGVKWEWGVKKWRFSLLSLAVSSEPSHLRQHLLYCAMYPLVAHEWYQNIWPWMTLNGHFALKSVSGSATNGLASPAFGQNCSKTCRATHIPSATKM